VKDFSVSSNQPLIAMKTIYHKPIHTLFLAVLMAASLTDRSAAQKSEAFTESPSTAGAVTIDVAAYANLCGEWTYRTTEDMWSTKILGTKNKAGKPIYLMQEYDEHGYPNDQDFLSADLSQGLYQTGGLNDYGQKTEETWFWKPSVPKLMKVFAAGKEYSVSHTRKDMPGTKIEMRMVTVEDTISVPHGRNLKCYKVTQTFSFNRENYVFQAWYAKNLGLVKRIQDDGELWELASYQPAPWLIVEQPAKSALFDGVSKMSFGTHPVGKPGVKKSFTVRNLGTEALTGLSISKNGGHSRDFIVSAPRTATLAPGKATTFTVTFAPKAVGNRQAAIRIFHAESKGNPFDIKLTGLGVSP
jgi:Abnormal spindle-like microcephaly-assoc'd, ASPM-SPD-2-Hydin